MKESVPTVFFPLLCCSGLLMPPKPLSSSVMSDSLQPHGVWPARHLAGMPFPSPVGLPNPGTEPRSPALQVDSLLSEPPEMPLRAQFL